MNGWRYGCQTVKVALFITCLTDQFHPRAGEAAVKVLEHLGHEVVFPKGQTCCGQPMYNNGFTIEARRLAKRMTRVFQGAMSQGAEAIVTPSGSCAAMVRRHFPQLFEDSPSDLQVVRGVAEHTWEFAEFLDRVLEIDLKTLGARWPGSVTWHFSCHLRDLEGRDATLRLLKGISELDYRPMAEMEQCCGFGGTFATSYPDVSSQMVAAKVEAISASGATAVVGNDTGCTMNIAGACRRRGQEMRFLTVAELLAEALGLMQAEASW